MLTFDLYTDPRHNQQGWMTWLRSYSKIQSIVNTLHNVYHVIIHEVDLHDLEYDYEITQDGWALRRVTTGTNASQYWAGWVKATYTPIADLRRIQATVDLVKLMAQNNGVAGESIGDFSYQAKDYPTERERILSQLRSQRRVVA